jgi:hypothetical protein
LSANQPTAEFAIEKCDFNLDLIELLSLAWRCLLFIQVKLIAKKHFSKNLTLNLLDIRGQYYQLRLFHVNYDAQLLRDKNYKLRHTPQKYTFF